MNVIPDTIKRLAPDATDVEYVRYRTEAIRLVQAMSSEVWTDYNFSDPGVTIIEQLAYALTELRYRADLPVLQILSTPGEPTLNLRRRALFPAWSVMPCNPVTVNDLRRLILDRVPGVSNVWFTPNRSSKTPRLLGLYDVAIAADPKVGDCDRLAERVLRCYGAHRALCEDIRVARVLEPIETIVSATVELEDAADPSATLAQILFNLSLMLSPEPRRSSLAEQAATGASTSEIFTGPLMLRGFIADAELTALPVSIAVDQLTQCVAETAGVLSVTALSVRVEGTTRSYGAGETVPVPSGCILRLQPTTPRGNYTISLRRERARYAPDPAQVERDLARLWRAQRRTYPLRRQYAERYGAPATSYRDLSTYTSVQTQFPVLYGIGTGELPRDASSQRRAQVKQLKGYLMPFDQLLADYFSQLGFVPALFSPETGGTKTYAVQSLRGVVPDAQPLLAPGYERGIEELAAQNDPVERRQNLILDLLLSLYGQELGLPESRGRRAERAADAALIRAKRELLRRLPLAGRDRARGMDYRRWGSWRGLTGVEFMSRLQLGLLDIAAELDDGRVDEMDAYDDHGEATDAPMRTSHATPLTEVDRTFRPDDEAGYIDDDEDDASDEPSPLASRHVPRALRATLDDPGCYRIHVRSERFVLVCCDIDGTWWEIGIYEQREIAVRGMWSTVREAERRRHAHHHDHHHYHHHHHHDRGCECGHRGAPSLSIVEWTLLRYAWLDPDATPPSSPFRISAVISASRDERDSAGWRRQARAIVRANTPAHIAVDCLFLGHARMRRFERLYRRWIEALRFHHGERRIDASRELYTFLTRNPR